MRLLQIPMVEWDQDMLDFSSDIEKGFDTEEYTGPEMYAIITEDDYPYVVFLRKETILEMIKRQNV